MFSKYYEKGLSVIPIGRNSKAPIIPNWTRYCDERPEQELIDRWDSGNYNIGVACGKASNIVVVDIDTDDPEILSLCPPSPVRRRGQKGECRFFKYSSDIQSMSIPQIDILASGRQVLIPPSIHPITKMPYVWLTPDTLENFDTEDLPLLDLSFLQKLSTKVSIKPVGRNNKLVDIVSSMRARGEAEIRIINEVYEWDKTFHEPRLFLDREEGFKGTTEEDAKRNAWKFIINITKSLIDNGTAVITEEEPLLVLDETMVFEEFTEKEYPRPTGLMNDIMTLIEQESQLDMPLIALGGAISVMATICCNRVKYNNIWPNMYILNLAPSGTGKGSAYRIINELLNNEKVLKASKTSLYGYGGYQSASSVIKGLKDQRVRLDPIDEASEMFVKMNKGGVFQSGIEEALCTLWSAGGTFFKGGEYANKKDESACWNPCLNILASSTVVKMGNSLTSGNMSGGLMARFVVFKTSEMGKQKKYSDCKRDYELEKRVINKIAAIVGKRQRIIGDEDKLGNNRYNPIDIAPEKETEAYDYFLELRDEIDAVRRTPKIASNESLSALAGRALEQIVKLATIHAVSNAREVTVDDLKWAKQVLQVSQFNAEMFIEEADNQNDYEKDVKRVLNFIIRRGCVSQAVITNKHMSIPPDRLNKLLSHLKTAEQIESFQKIHPKNGQKSLFFTKKH